tara:strand:- start:64630 stop:64926 length:297 start_codon:yes stop_codon:yes gene_type:complete
MNALLIILGVCALSVGLVTLLPLLTLGVVLLVALGAFFIWFLPILIIASSDETRGGEKICWILAILFLSWFAWVFYFFLAPLKPKHRIHYQHYHGYQY